MSVKINSGIKGLDEILKGGFIPRQAYLLQGGPGTGKSSIAYHFLKESESQNETGLYITLGESRENLLKNAESIGIDMSDVDFLDLTPTEDVYRDSQNYNVFPSSEVEQKPLVHSVVNKIEQINPDRVVLDSITMLRFLTSDPFQYRNLALSFIKYIQNQGATLLMISENSGHSNDRDSTFWVDGIIKLEYTPHWRELAVTKYRGSDFNHGPHAFKITGHGVHVYPRLVPSDYESTFVSETLSTGIDEMDNMLNGGFEKGTISLITGPSGVGKTNFGLQLIKESAARNERATLYTFEESAEVLKKRSEFINIPISDMLESGNLNIVSIEPLSYSPDEFSEIVKKEVEENGTRIVVIDTIGGYNLAVRGENSLERLHSLTVYLQNMGVTGFLLNETKDISGQFKTTDMNASYLADNIVFLRYLELKGELTKAIGILKKRMSDFERNIREFKITSEGIRVGKPLNNLRGILRGSPEEL